VSETRLLRADAVFLGEGPPILGGAVVVDDVGTVLAAGDAATLVAAFPSARTEAHPGLLMPGLVNAHTHLELSALRGRTLPGRGFVGWVDGMLAARGEVDEAEEAEGIARGVAELVASGTVAVGDVTNTLGAVGALRRAGICGSVFHEVFGLDAGRTLERVRTLAREAEALGLASDPLLAWSPSPHTLHTTHPEAVRALAELARARAARISVHLAEHGAERLALEQGAGPMVDWLEARTKTPRERFRWHAEGPVAVAEKLGVLGADCLAVHLTDARPEELERIAQRGAHAVLCPRSNLFIETRLPPLHAILRAGLEPALGTDSLASCPTLDVLAEAKALQERFAELPAHAFLTMATRNGARALGLTGIGAFTTGARPGVLLVEGAIPEALDPALFALRRPMSARRLLVPARPGARP
jgi:cytosine/adenosine deaminase-related metal-dependent hydrolase